MSARLVIQLTDQFPLVHWRLVDGTVGSGQLHELVAQLGPRPEADVLVPAGAVLLAEVHLPGRHRSRLLQALPYAMEEQLTDDVDAYHFALGRQLSPNRYLVAAVARERMSLWFRALSNASIDVRRMVPETLVLPCREDTATVALEPERALLRVSASRGYAASLREVSTFLELETDLKRLLVLDYTGAWQAPAGLEVEYQTSGEHLLEALAQGLQQPLLLDLMQGRYQSPRQRGALALRWWRWAAAVVVLALALELLSQFLHYRHQAHQLAQLQQKSSAIVQQALPQIVPGIDLRQQMEERLLSLRGDRGGRDFLYLLRVIAPGIAAARQVTVESLIYRGDGLIIDLRAPDLATLEAVRQRIAASVEVPVDLLSASTLGDGADGRLRIGGDTG